MGVRDAWRRRFGDVSRLPRDVLILTVISFTVAVGFGVVVPVLPVFARSFHVSTLAVSVVVSGFAAMRFVTAPVCSRLIAFAGERVVLAVGVGIVAVSSALMAYAGNYAQLLIWRSAGGVGSAMFTVSALTRLLGVTPAELRGRAAALYQGGFLLGGMAGPAIGGALLAVSMRAPFLFYAAMLVVAGGVGLGFLRGRAPSVSRDEPPDTVPDGGPGGAGNSDDAPDVDGASEPRAPSMRRLVRDVRYQAACVASLAQGWSSFGIRNALVPLLVTESLRLPATWTGAAFAIAAVPQALALGPAGSITDRRGRRPAIIAAGGLAAVLMMAIPASGSIGVLIAVLCLYALPSALLSTAPAALVGDVGGRGGKAVAVFSMCSDAGSIIGPIAAGALVDALNMEAAFATGALLFAATCAFGIAMPRRRAPADGPHGR